MINLASDHQAREKVGIHCLMEIPIRLNNSSQRGTYSVTWYPNYGGDVISPPTKLTTF
jgi:hypothetical protein